MQDNIITHRSHKVNSAIAECSKCLTCPGNNNLVIPAKMFGQRTPILSADPCEVPNRAGRNCYRPLSVHLEDSVSVSKRKIIEYSDNDFFWDVMPQFWHWSRHFANSVRFKCGETSKTAINFHESLLRKTKTATTKKRDTDTH